MPNPVRRLAIVGASARAAAFSAMRAGYEVVAADLFADADLARLADVTRVNNYPDGFVDWLTATECDAWMYTGALENHPDLIDRMATIRPLLGNCGAALRDVRDPLKLQTALTEAGVPFPETRASTESLPRDGSWLCKTYCGASGSGVWALDGPGALDRARRDDAVFQRRISGEPASAIYVAQATGAVLLGLTRQLLSDDAKHPWQYVGSLGPVEIEPHMAQQLAAIGDVLAARFRLVGVIGVDLVLTPGGLQVIEVNPRYTASVEIVERFSPSHALAGVGDDPARSRKCASEPRSHGFFAKSILFAARDATVSPRFFDWAIAQSSPDLDHCQLADIPHAGEAIPAGRPVLTVFAMGNSQKTCKTQLHERLAEVESRLYDE